MTKSFSAIGGGASTVTLQLLGNTDNFDPKVIKEAVESLELLEGTGKQNVKRLKELITQAKILSKTPFLDQKSITMADRGIGALKKRMENLRSILEQNARTIQNAQMAFNKTYGGLTPAEQKSRASEIKAQQAQIMGMKKNNALIAGEYRNSAVLFDNWVTARNRSVDRLEKLEQRRSRLEKEIYTYAQRGTYSQNMKQQLLELSKLVSNIDVKMLSGKGANLKTGKYAGMDRDMMGQSGLAEAEKRFKNIQNILARQQATLGPLAQAWNKFKVVFMRVVDALLSFYVINAAQQIFFGFFKSLIDSNKLMEVTEARLKTLVVEGTKFAQIQGFLQDLTITTPFGYKELVDASVLVRAYGIDIERNMRAIADWSSSIGKDMSDTAVAFGKIVNYSPRTALLLSTRGFSKSMFDAYATKYNDRELALRKMVEESFGGMSKRISDTFEGTLANMSDIWIFVTQKIGKDFFKMLNSGLETTFNLLKALNGEGSKFLEWTGWALAKTIQFSTVFGLTIGIGWLLSKLPAVIASLKTMSLTMAGMSKWNIIAAGLVVGAGVVNNWRSANQNRDKIRELKQEAVKPGLSSREQLEVGRELLQTQERHLDLLKDAFRERVYEINQLERAVDLQKKRNLELEKAVKASERLQALDIAKGTPLENYQMSQKVSKLGLRPVMKQQIASLENKLVPGSMDFAAMSEDKITYLKSQIIYLKAISGEITREQASKQLLTALNEYIENSWKTASNVKQDVVKFIETYQEYLESFESLEPPKDKKALQEYRDFAVELAGLQASISGGEDGMTNKMSAFNKALAETRVGISQFASGSFTLKDLADYASKIKLVPAVAGDNASVNKQNEALMRQAGLLDVLRNKYIGLKESLIKELEQQKKAIEDYNKKVLTVRKSYENLQMSLVKKRQDEYGRENLNRLMGAIKKDQAKTLEDINLSTGDKKIKSEEKYIRLLGREMEVYEMLHRNAASFGEAYYSIVKKLRVEHDQLYDTLANMSVDFFTSTGKGIISEIFFGDRAKDLDAQIDDLRFKLIELNAEKAGTKLIEDTEVSANARLNELLEERGNVLLPIIEDGLKNITEKMSEAFLDQLVVKPILELFTKEEAAQQKAEFTDLETRITQALAKLALMSSTAFDGMLTDLNSSAAKVDEIISKMAVAGLLNGLSSLGGFSAEKPSPMQPAGIPGFNNPIDVNLRKVTPYTAPRHERMANIGRSSSSSSSTTNNTSQVIIQGPVYGWDDFKKKVDEANRERDRRMVRK